MLTVLMVGGVCAVAVVFACLAFNDRSAARQEAIKREAGDPMYAPVILISNSDYSADSSGGSSDGIG